VPERSNFAALLEAVDERRVRCALVERLRSRLSAWLGEPREVFLLGTHSSELRAWTDAGPLMERDLSDSEMEILFTYFSDPVGPKDIVLGISRNARASVYDLSFPAQAMVAHADKAFDVLSAFFEEISAMDIRCIVAGGPEMEFDESFQSVKDVIRSAGEFGSLIDFVFCDKKDAIELRDFVTANEHGGGVMFMRSRNLPQ
jgi:hypothetical protein